MISQVSGPLEYDKLQTISPGPIIAPQRRFLTPIGLAKMVTAQSHEPFLAPPHILLLQDRAMKLIAKPGRSVLIIMLPVRHGKSHFLCQYLPAWYMMNYPSRHCLLTTYADDFSRSWGEKAREIFREWGPKLFPGIKLSGSHHAAHDWRVDGKNTGGTMRSIGVGGQISGYGAHLLIGDDLVRNQDEADSVAMRDFTWKWFISDCYTRLEPDGKLIMVLSRRNMADLVGALLEVLQKAGTDHEVLRLAAICDSPDDPLGRKLGEPLWPARYPLEVLQEIRRTYEAKGESYLFEALFNQNPIGDPASRSFPPEYFTNIWVDAIPDNNVVLRILSLDPSSGKGDYSAFIDATYTSDNVVYIRSRMEICNTTQTENLFVELVRSAVGRPFDGLVIETNGVGEAIARSVAQRLVPRIVHGVCNSRGGGQFKPRIMTGLTPVLHQGRLKLLNDKQCSHNRILFNQLQGFPTYTNDDGPDSTELNFQLWGFLRLGLAQGGGNCQVLRV